MNIAEIRKKYPQYDSVSDGKLAAALRQKNYPDMPMGEFADRIGLSSGAFKEMVSSLEAQGVNATGRTISKDHETGLGALRSAFQGATFGFGDEIVAGGRAAVDAMGGEDFGASYDATLQAERQRLSDYSETDGGKALAAELGGAVMAPLGALGKFAQGGSRMGTAARSGALGAGMAATYGFGAGEGGAEGRADSAVDAVPMGIAGGLAAPVVGGVVQRGADRFLRGRTLKELAKSAPTSDELRKTGRAAYDAADAAAPISRAPMATAADDMVREGSDKGLDLADRMSDSLTPKSQRATELIEEAATKPEATISFRELDRLRKKTGAAAGDVTNRTDSAIGTLYIEKLDDFVSSLSPEMGEAALEARQTWRKLLKNDMIEDVLENAHNYRSGFESGIKNGFSNILRSKKLSRGLTADEKLAMRAVINGDGLLGKAISQIGRFGLATQGGSNALGAGLGVGGGAAAGGALGGPVGAIIGGGLSGLATAGARRLSEAQTKRAAEIARAVIASGGKVDYKRLSPEMRMAVEDMTRRLSAVQ